MDSYLTLAYKGLDSINPALIKKYGQSVKHLDLSYNKLTDKSLGPIAGFEQMESLVLDGNLLSSYVTFPYLPNLHTLSVNKNKIEILSVFIEKLVCCSVSFIVGLILILKIENKCTKLALSEYAYKSCLSQLFLS